MFRKSLLLLSFGFAMAVTMAVPAQVQAGETTKTQASQAKAKKVKHKRKASGHKSKRLKTSEFQREMGSYHVVNGLPTLQSAYALVLDQTTGEPIYAKKPNQQTPIASITKLMTAMVVLDAGLALDESITIQDSDVDKLRHSRSRLPVGTTLSRADLLHLALIASENRAASALSQAYPGGREAFVTAMNHKARALGMQDSQFHDGTGLHSGNRSTARDLAKMVSAAYRYPLIRDISAQGSYDILVPGRRSLHSLAFNNTNALTRHKNWEIGVSKTGFINEAGHCLVMQAKITEKPVIIVLLDSAGRFSRIGDANRIRRWMEEGGSRRAALSRKSRAV